MKTTPATILAIPPVFLLLLAFTTSSFKPAENTRLPSTPVDSLFSQAVRLKSALKFDSASILLGQIAPQYQAQQQWDRYLECQSHLAYCLWISHQSEQAVALCQRMIQEGSQRLGPDAIELAGLYTVLGNVHADRRSQQDYEQCVAYYHRALEITQKHFGANHPAVSGAYERLGIARYLIDDYAGAIPFYEKALAYLDAPGPYNAGTYYKTHLNLGLNYFGMGQFRQALQHFSRARYYLSEVLGQKDARFVKASINMAEALIQLGEVDEALFTLEEARLLEEQVVEAGNKLKVYYRGCFGEAHEAKKDYEKAISYYQECLAYWDAGKRDDINGLILEHARMGACYLALQQTDRALRHFQQAVTLLDKYYEPDNFTWVEPLLSLGRAWRAKGERVEAQRVFRRALSIATGKMGQQHPVVGKIRMELASLQLASGQAAAAYEEALRAQGAFLLPGSEQLAQPPVERINNLTAFVANLELQGEIKTAQYEENGDLADLFMAEQSFLKSLTYSDSLKIGLQSSADVQQAQQQVYDLSEKALACLYTLWQLSGSEKYIREALLFFEKSKSDWLRTSSREWLARRYAGVPDSLVEKELSLRSQFTYYRELKRNAGSELLPEHTYKTAIWQERFVQSKRQLNTLLVQLEKEYPAYYRLKYGYRLAELDELTKTVREQQVSLITFFWGKKNAYAMCIDGKKAKWIKIADLDCVEQHLYDFEQAALAGNGRWQSDQEQRQAFRSFAENGFALYELLLKPALDGKDLHRLVLIPDGPLGQLPFQILPDSKLSEDELHAVDYRKFPYVLRRVSVQYEHSAILFLQPARPGPPRQNYLGFAPSYQNKNTLAAFFRGNERTTRASPAEREGWQALPYAQEEIWEIAELTGGDKMLGSDATEDRFRQLASKAGILHVAGHAYSDRNEPDYSALIFSEDPDRPEDGQLYAYELYNMPLQARLAVLSACNTGSGLVRRGEGVMSLSRTFRYAGCPSVMMSLWSANDASTRKIVIDFFRQLSQGKNKSVALQEATLEYLATVKSDQFTHPFYWGNFVVVGRDDALEFEVKAARYHWTLLLGSLLLIGSLAVSWWRKTITSTKPQ